MKIRFQQLLPGGIAQRRRRMERGHDHEVPHLVKTTAQFGDADLGLEHEVRGGVAHRHDDIRPDAPDLLAQKRAAGQHLIGLGITVSGRTALEHVGDIDVLATQARQSQDAVQILARTANERLPLQVFVTTRRLAHEQHPSLRIAHAEYDLRPCLGKLAPTAIA